MAEARTDEARRIAMLLLNAATLLRTREPLTTFQTDWVNETIREAEAAHRKWQAEPPLMPLEEIERQIKALKEWQDTDRAELQELRRKMGLEE